MFKGKIKSYNSSQYDRKFKFAITIIIVAFSILAIRLWYIQIIQGSELREQSVNNAVRVRTIRAVRGVILDRNGEILVDNQPAYNVVFSPNPKADIGKMIEKLKEIYVDQPLLVSPETLVSKNKKGIDIVRIEKNVPRERVALIEANAFELPCISIEVAPTRLYKFGEKMAHVIGYTGEISKEDANDDDDGIYAMGDFVGKTGIEKVLDKLIRGQNGAEQVAVNAKGREERVIGKIAPIAGNNVILNIDAKLQTAIYSAVGGKAAAVVVMDVTNGAVLALVSSPSFDPNSFMDGLPKEEWSKITNNPKHPMENKATVGLYPPGSTYKPFVAIAALEEKLVDEETTFNCKGAIDFGGRSFRCWLKTGHGKTSLHKAIVESCDVYFYNIGRMIGVDNIAKYANAFGFGSITGIDMDREKKGNIPTKAWKMNKFKKKWALGDTISASIGQGYDLVTPLQLAVAYAAIANGGIVWRPRVVNRVESVNGEVVKDFPPQKIRTIEIGEGTLSLIRKALWGVVNENGGTGIKAKGQNVSVCGKTGTAQVISMPQNDKSKKQKRSGIFVQDHALFVGYAPYSNPEIVVAVVMENAGHGGVVAAPVAKVAIDTYFNNKKK